MIASRAAALAWIVSSAGLCGKSQPPVLFHSDAGHVTAGDAAASIGDSGAAADAGSPQAPLLSNAVPGDGSSLTLDGLTVQAEGGERFQRYVALDPDGDGDRDVVLLAQPSTGAVPRVEYYRRDAAHFVAVPIDAGAPPADPRCARADVRSNSPRSVVAIYNCRPAGATNGDAGAPEAPLPFAAEHIVVDLTPTPAARLRVDELLPGLAGTLVATDVVSADRDGDGKDDVTVNVSVRGQTEREEQALHASAVWLQRESGFARETTEPEASFARAVASIRPMVTRRRAAEAVAAVERLIRLRRAFCADAGTARVRIGNEAGVDCRGSASLAAASELEARAYLAAGELPAALALTVPDTASELGVVSSERFASDLRRATPVERGLLVRHGPPVGTALQAAVTPRATALFFEPPGAPLAIRVGGTEPARVDLTNLQVVPGATGSPAELRAHSADGSLVLHGFYETCDGLFAVLCPSNAGDCVEAAPRPDAIPPGAVLARIMDRIAVEHAARCVRENGDIILRAARVVPIGFTREALVVTVRGGLYRVPLAAGPAAVPVVGNVALGGPFAAGSSASSDGAHIVVAGFDGLYVRDASGRWRLWSDAQLLGRYSQLTELAVSDDGRTVAAMLGADLWVFGHEIPAAPVAPLRDAGSD